MVSSDADEELLFNIPFTGNVKLKGLIVMGGSQGFHPSKVKLYKNRPHMTFDDAQGPADQEFELIQDDEGNFNFNGDRASKANYTFFRAVNPL